MYSLSNKFPDLMKLESVHSKYGIPHQAGKWGDIDCVIIMATITDNTVHNDHKPQVLLSGAVHGNERLGPNIVTYFAEYLLYNYQSKPFIKKLLQEREIIITPFFNAQGYHYNKRTESTDLGDNIDINRDFPYNRESGDFKWFSSVGARAALKIFQNNLIVGWITYHAGSEDIGYSWGSMNHVKDLSFHNATESPDMAMFQGITQEMVVQSSTINHADYPADELTNGIYACGGSLDDWAYGSSWDKTHDSKTPYWIPQSYAPYDNKEYFENTDHINTALILIEASTNKAPPNEEYGNKKNIYCKAWDSEGWINRNIRLLLAYVDLLQPYPVIKFPIYNPMYHKLQIKWRLNGWRKIDSMTIEIKLPNDEDFISYDKTPTNGGNWNWDKHQTEFSHIFAYSPSENANEDVLFRIRFKADQDFGKQDDPDPEVPPQTYVSKLRLEDDYSFEINGKKLTNT